MFSAGFQFPSRNISEGHRHVDLSGGGEFRYLGGDPLDLTNSWLLAGGELRADPDTTGWGDIQKGAQWFNTTTNRFRGWNGSAIINIDGSSDVAAFSGALVTISSAQSIPHNTQDVLLFDTEEYDEGDWHSTSSNTSRLTVPANVSRIQLNGAVVWDANGTGNRLIYFIKNGDQVNPFVGGAAQQTLAGTNEDLISTASAVVDVVEGDYFELGVFQNSGVALDVVVSLVAFAQTMFSIKSIN